MEKRTNGAVVVDRAPKRARLSPAHSPEGVRGLPVITLASGEKLQTDALQDKRPRVFVQTPFTACRFASEVRSLVKPSRASLALPAVTQPETQEWS